MSILMSIFLGIVQGITEFLPISSSGHLSILQNLLKLGYAEESHLLFDVLLHLGTLVSICVVYRKDIALMIKGFIRFLRGSSDFSEFGDPLVPPARQALFIIVGTLPLFILVPFYSKISLLYGKTVFIGFALLVTGALLYASDKYLKEGKKNEKTMTVLDALLIGVGQAIALIPGLSRSGTTITVGISRGLDRNYAVRFSLLLSIPAVLGSLILSLFDAFKTGIDWSLIPVYLIGFVVSAVVGYFAIGFLKKIMSSGKFGRFAYYCWAVGFLAILLSIIL